jgi:hypothetical protein
MMLGMRFLTDYLEGDRYFKIEHPQQNLDRARNQFHLVRSMEAQSKDMAAIARRVFHAGGVRAARGPAPFSQKGGRGSPRLDGDVL